MQNICRAGKTGESKSFLCFLCCLLFFTVCSSSQGDIVRYNLGGLEVLLEGTTTINPGGTVTVTHSKFGKLHLPLDRVDIKKALPVPSQYSRMLGKAGTDPEGRMAAAQWALRRGMLPQFYAAIDKVLEVDPKHPRATLVKQLKTKMDLPLGDATKQIEELKSLIGRNDMKFKTTKHFVLMHDTPDKLIDGKKTRADERAQLLETVYECFLLRFYAYGVELEIPKERLKVVLFNDYAQFRVFGDRLDPSLASAAGFWDPERNTSVFFDNSTTELFKRLKEMSDDLQRQKKDAQRARALNAGDISRLADTIQMLIEIEREETDIKVVSHEATHQMAGNTGLLPRHVRIPSWVHEGLATYFETPDGAKWGGIGAVNEERLTWYRALEPDKEHSNIGFIVGDQIFDYAGSHGSTLHGYAQAWALTHFLMEKHFEQFLAFYRRLGELPPDTFLSQEIINQIFAEAIETERGALDQQWRHYMSSLKTDIQQILEADK